MNYNPENPIIVQGDKSVLLEVDNPHYPVARDMLARFAELEKSPEYVHTYRITPLSLWNAASTGLDAATIVDGLARYSKYPLPQNVRVDIQEYISRYGRVKLLKENGRIAMVPLSQLSNNDLRFVRAQLRQSKRLAGGQLASQAL